MEVAAPTTGALNQQPQQAPGENDALRGLALEGFLKLMVTELQNQDPLDPMDNSEILAQISQIREIEASTNMSKVLETVASSIDGIALGQRIAGASGLMGKYVEADVEVTIVPAEGQTDAEPKTETKTIQGLVDRVSFNGAEPIVYVDGTAIKLSQIVDVASSASGLRKLDAGAGSETPPPAEVASESVVAQGLGALAELQSKLIGSSDSENSTSQTAVSRADILRLLQESADQ